MELITVDGKMKYIRSIKTGEGIAFYLAAILLAGIILYITWMTYRPLPDEVLSELVTKAISLSKDTTELKAIPDIFRPEPPDFKALAAQLGPIVTLFLALFGHSGQQKRHKENMAQPTKG